MQQLVLPGILAALLLAPEYATAQLARDPDSIANGWQFNYAKARELARRTNRPLMVVFRCVP